MVAKVRTFEDEVLDKLDDHESRLRAVETIVTKQSTTMDAILVLLKWIAGITSVIAAGLLLEFFKRN